MSKSYQYPVTSVFKTLQGEGHFTGYPMTFIRLAGCSIGACHIRAECDEAPWKATERLEAAELARRAWSLGPGIACITGGEPSDHDLRPLVDCLLSYGMRVHLETSGFRSVEGIPVDWLTVSPKTKDYAQRTGHVLKVVVRPGMEWTDVLELDRDTTFFHRYMQPMTSPDGTNNLSEVIAMVRGHSVAARWALSTQAHRLWGVP